MDRTLKILIPVILLLIPTYLIRFSVLGIPTNILEILVLVAFILCLIQSEYSFLDFYKNNKVIFWSIVAIFMGALISVFANSNWRVGFGIIKGWFVVPLAFSWVIYKSLKAEKNAKNILKWLYLGIFGVAIISLGYYFSNTLTYDGRLAGIYNSPNFLAMYVSPAIFIGLYIIRNQNSKLKTQNQTLKLKAFYYLLIIVFFLILLVLYLTYSYAAWLAVILSLTITCLAKNKKFNKQLILISLIIILLIVISQWNSEKLENLNKFTRSSLKSRIIIWQSALKILQDNYLWGIGPGNFQEKYLEYQRYFPPYLEWAVPQPHNLYLAFWLQTGIIGLIGFLIIVFTTLLRLVIYIRQTKNGDLAAVLLAILIYILIHGLVDTPYWKNDLALIFWLIIALSHIICHQCDLQKTNNLLMAREIN